MRIVIHAGIHRTGTTSLQRNLSENRDALAAQGIGYPGHAAHHQTLAWALKRGDADARDVEALLATAPEAGMAILSGEDFSIHEDLGWLAALAARHEVRAVFYLRRQDHWVMSWYNQHVKWPFAEAKSQMGPEAFLDTLDDFHWLDYAALLGRWTEVLGPGRVAVGVVERGQVEDVTGDFLDRLGIARNGLALDGTRSNDSLPVHMLEIARHLGLYEMRPGQRTRLLNALRAGLGDKAPGAGTVYSPEERRAILARFEASNRAVARDCFGREALFFESPPEDGAPYYRFPDMDRETLMRDWVAPVIRELLRAGR